MGEGLDPTDRYARATTWLPVVVGALLVVVVAIFIFEAPNQIVTPKDNGYLIASSPAPPVVTAMQ